MIDTTKNISKVTYNGSDMPLATQSRVVTPTTEEQVITGDDGYTLTSVTVEAVTKDIDSNIQSGNIKSGVSILGVEGVLEGNKLPEVLNKTVTTLTAEDLAGATQIPQYMFYRCTDLVGVELLDTITSIEEYAFYECNSLINIILSLNLESIGINAFNGCSSLTSITLPLSLTSIGSYAFYYCSGLTSVDLSGCTNLTSIGDNAFRGCSGLTSISLPANLTSMGSRAFQNCTNLITMRVEAPTPPTLSSTNAISTATTQIQVPMASVDAYKTATNWSNFADIIVGYAE